MTPLDDLYRPGATDLLRTALDLQSAVRDSTFEYLEEVVEDGVGTRTTYFLESDEVGMLTITWRPTSAFYSLSVEPDYMGRGIYRETVCAQSALLAELGITALVAEPADERAEYLLALGGFHWQDFEGERRFCTKAIGDRAQDYREWIGGGRRVREPAWHARLVANSMPSAKVY